MDDIDRQCFESIAHQYLSARNLELHPEHVHWIICKADELWTGNITMGAAVTEAIDAYINLDRGQHP